MLGRVGVRLDINIWIKVSAWGSISSLYTAYKCFSTGGMHSAHSKPMDGHNVFHF